MTRRRLLTLSRAVDQFRTHLALERGSSPKAIATSDETLGRMLDVLGADTDPASLDKHDALQVLATWAGRKPNTLRKHVFALKRFGAWLETDHDITDPFANLAAPKRATAAKPRPGPVQVRSLIDHATGRDRLVVLLFAYTGMRVGDLRNLLWGDVDHAQRTIWITDGKGHKGRGLPIPRILARELADEHARRTEQGTGQPDHYVVCRVQTYRLPQGDVVRTDPTMQIGETTPYKIVQRAAEAAGVGPLHPHQLRRAYADAYLQQNPRDILTLQAILGHTRLETTRDYLEATTLQHAIRQVSGFDYTERSNPSGSMPTGQAPETPATAGVSESSGGGGNRTRARQLDPPDALGIEPPNPHGGQNDEPGDPA